MTGINGGDTLTTGYGHVTVLTVADKVIDAVKAGAIKHFFLVGGCDGAKPGRNYYTDFVKATPKDSVILTLACGKYRFNDLDLGALTGGLPSGRSGSRRWATPRRRCARSRPQAGGAVATISWCGVACSAWRAGAGRHQVLRRASPWACRARSRPARGFPAAPA